MSTSESLIAQASPKKTSSDRNQHDVLFVRKRTVYYDCYRNSQSTTATKVADATDRYPGNDRFYALIHSLFLANQQNTQQNLNNSSIRPIGKREMRILAGVVVDQILTQGGRFWEERHHRGRKQPIEQVSRDRAMAKAVLAFTYLFQNSQEQQHQQQLDDLPQRQKLSSIGGTTGTEERNLEDRYVGRVVKIQQTTTTAVVDEGAAKAPRQAPFPSTSPAIHQSTFPMSPSQSKNLINELNQPQERSPEKTAEQGLRVQKQLSLKDESDGATEEMKEEPRTYHLEFPFDFSHESPDMSFAGIG